MSELKHCASAYFATLTYDDESLTYGANGEATLNKREVQLFLKKIRYELSKNYKYINQEKKFKYFIVGEYGSKSDRPHYHAIFFNIPPTVDVHKLLTKYWNYGHTHIGSVTVKSISYTAKYVIQEICEVKDKARNFAIMSLRPAIGYDYIDAFKTWHRDNKAFYGLLEGKKVSLPRYYKSKIFSSKELMENLEKYQAVRDELLNEKIKNYPEMFLSMEVGKMQLQNSIKSRTNKNSKL